MAKLVCGCGYLGLPVARHWQAAGYDTFAITRSSTRAGELKAEGIHPLVMDLTGPVKFPSGLSFETVLFAVGFDRSAEKTIQDVFVGGLRRVLDALRGSSPRLLYISSTGVFGQKNGEWVDESSPCDPRRKGGIACLEAERTLLDHPLGTQAVILRLAGIYGPGRIPKFQILSAGRPLAVPPDGYLNLIHRDDAVNVILAAESDAEPPCTFTVSDGHAVTRRDFYQEVARCLDAPAPRFVTPDPTQTSSQRAISSKRVRNARMLSELAISLQYPSYREGLASMTGRKPPPDDASS